VIYLILTKRPRKGGERYELYAVLTSAFISHIHLITLCTTRRETNQHYKAQTCFVDSLGRVYSIFLLLPPSSSFIYIRFLPMFYFTSIIKSTRIFIYVNLFNISIFFFYEQIGFNQTKSKQFYLLFSCTWNLNMTGFLAH
jgi:hypothetical protein